MYNLKPFALHHLVSLRCISHTESTRYDKVSPSPLPQTTLDRSLVRRGMHVHPHTESTWCDTTMSLPPLYPRQQQICMCVGVCMFTRTLSRTFRATRVDTIEAVTKCSMLHFWCDMWPFCEPDHVRKIAIYTAEEGWECSFYKIF